MKIEPLKINPISPNFFKFLLEVDINDIVYSLYFFLQFGKGHPIIMSLEVNSS